MKLNPNESKSPDTLPATLDDGRSSDRGVVSISAKKFDKCNSVIMSTVLTKTISRPVYYDFKNDTVG